MQCTEKFFCLLLDLGDLAVALFCEECFDGSLPDLRSGNSLGEKERVWPVHRNIMIDGGYKCEVMS